MKKVCFLVVLFFGVLDVNAMLNMNPFNPNQVPHRQSMSHEQITLTDCNLSIDTLNVAEAISLIQSNNYQTLNTPCYIKGTVSQALSGSYWPGYVNIWLSDINDPSLQFEGYKIYKDASQTEWLSIADIPCSVKDTVILYANGLSYYAKNQIYETTSGYLSKVFPFDYKEYDIATCKELWDIAISGETKTRQISGIVTYVNNSQFFFQDITGGMQVYSPRHNLSVGDVFTAYGTTSLSEGAPEVIQLTNIQIKSTQTPLATNISLHNVCNYPNQLVQLEGLKLYAKSDSTLSFCQNGDSIQYFNRSINTQDYEINAYYDATVVINIYHGFVLNGYPENITLNNKLTNYFTFYVSSTNPSMGSVIGESGTYLEGTQLTIQAIPQSDNVFLKWSDGSIERTRTILLTQDTLLIAEFGYPTSGQCGDDLTWKYSDGILVISRTGAMYNYTQDSAPWMTIFKDSISGLVINNGATTIGDYAFCGLSNKNLKTIDLPNSIIEIGQYAFANCGYLKNLYLGTSVENIAANAFANDERLLYITCYAIEPPLLDESAFVNYDVYLSVPCESQADYKVAKGWKLFNKENVSCIGVQSTDPVTEVTTTTGDTEVTITWPTNTNATSYTIEISSKGVLVCTLVFNADGILTGINFPVASASARFAKAVMPKKATLLANGGMQFTVTGLDSGTDYTYIVIIEGEQGQELDSFEGAFKTMGERGITTAIDEVEDSRKSKVESLSVTVCSISSVTARGIMPLAERNKPSSPPERGLSCCWLCHCWLSAAT